MINRLRVGAMLAAIAGAGLLASCGAPEETSAPEAQATAVIEEMDTLVSAQWLADHIDDPDLVVLDASVFVDPEVMQVMSGRERYEAGHIPGAGFADLMGDLTDADTGLMFSLPEPEEFASAMEALGVHDGARVVLYDADNSGWAARVWWMLRWIGFDNAALLDGGLAAWQADGRTLSTEAVSRPVGELTVSLRPEIIADRDDVLEAVETGSACIFDALTEEVYRGEAQMYARPGHISGAMSVPTSSLYDENGRLKPNAELESMFRCEQNKQAITYCGGGIAASADAFALHRLGRENVAVYISSLQEWAADPANPMVTGATPDGQ